MSSGGTSARKPTHRPDKGHRRAAASAGHPARPGLGEEGEIVRGVDPGGGVERVLVGREDRPQPDLRDPGADDLGPPRQLEGRDDLAGHQLDVAGVAGVARRIHRLHGAETTLRTRRGKGRAALAPASRSG